MSAGSAGPSRLAKVTSACISSRVAFIVCSSAAKSSVLLTLLPQCGFSSLSEDCPANSEPFVLNGEAIFLPHPAPFAIHSLTTGPFWSFVGLGRDPWTLTHMSRERTSSTFRTTPFSPIMASVPVSHSSLAYFKKTCTTVLSAKRMTAICNRSCVLLKNGHTLCACASGLSAGCSDGTKPLNETIAQAALTLASKVPNVNRRRSPSNITCETGNISPEAWGTLPHLNSQTVPNSVSPTSGSRPELDSISSMLIPFPARCCCSIAASTAV